MISRNTFTARFDGECQICLDEVFEGDEAGYVHDEFACEECWYEAKLAEGDDDFF